MRSFRPSIVIALGIWLAACVSIAAAGRPHSHCCAPHRFSSKQKDTALFFYNKLRNRHFPPKFLLPEDNYTEAKSCGIAKWVIRPSAVGMKFKRYCVEVVKKPGGEVLHKLNITLIFRDSCNRKVRLDMNATYGGCPDKVTKDGNPLLLPVTRIKALKPVKKFVFPDATTEDGCPPYAPIKVRQHSRIDPDVGNFYSIFFPSFSTVWWPQQHNKPFKWGAVTVWSDYQRATCHSSTWDRAVGLYTISTWEFEINAPETDGPIKTWGQLFYINVTLIPDNHWEDGCNPQIEEYKYRLV